MITQHEGHNLALKTHFDWLIVVLLHLSRTNKLLSWEGISFFFLIFNWTNAWIDVVFCLFLGYVVNAGFQLKLILELPESAYLVWLFTYKCLINFKYLLINLFCIDGSGIFFQAFLCKLLYRQVNMAVDISYTKLIWLVKLVGLPFFFLCELL